MQSSNGSSKSVQDHDQYGVKDEPLDTSSIGLGHAEQEIHLPEQHGDAPPVDSRKTIFVYEPILPNWTVRQLQRPPNPFDLIDSLRKRGIDAESYNPPAKRRETAENPALERAADWAYELPGPVDWVRELPDTESMSSAGDSSDTLSTDHAECDLFLKHANIHDLDPDLKPRGLDDLQRYLALETSEPDFCDCEWEEKFKSWHRYADTHAGEDSLKAMHHALRPRASMDVPQPHRWDMDLTWKTFDKQDGFRYKPDYFVGLDPKTLQSHFLDDPELSAYFRPHKDGAVYPHTVAEFKSSFGTDNHAIGDIRYGGAVCATTTLLLRRHLLGYQACFDVPLSTSYTITPEGFRCYVHFCRLLEDEIHYYAANVLNLTMGASWMEFRSNLRQFWRFLSFGQSLRESDLQRGLFREVRPEAALTLDAWLDGSVY